MYDGFRVDAKDKKMGSSMVSHDLERVVGNTSVRAGLRHHHTVVGVHSCKHRHVAQEGRLRAWRLDLGDRVDVRAGLGLDVLVDRVMA